VGGGRGHKKYRELREGKLLEEECEGGGRCGQYLEQM
jgi:hypothetical protein